MRRRLQLNQRLRADHKLTLEFSINGEPRSVSVKSSRDLNSGEWQQVWIDYNEYHVRFTVNQESILVDLNDGEEFGPFEATLFIGGAPELVALFIKIEPK